MSAPPKDRTPLTTKPVLGLVGGIGSGKSTVGRELAKQGGRVVEGDGLGHEALRQPEIRKLAVARWGEDILAPDGTIDRAKVAAIVFADAHERAALESMVFPHIERRLREELQAADRDSAVKFIVLDAAIMLEKGWSGVCDLVAFVDVPEAERHRRLAGRGWSAAEIQRRDQAQWSPAEKRRHAQVVIDNSGPPESLASQVAELASRLAKRPATP